MAKMTRRKIQESRVKEVSRLGHEFPLFLEFDRDELVRNAIFEFNHLKRKNVVISDEEIGEILRRIESRGKDVSSKMLFVINNPISRKRGLYAILGKDLFRLINKDGNLRGVLTVFARDVRICHNEF